ncbi:MAG: hypothetical protein IJ494_07120 [Bacteroides sp.]|nr:hypothetical protein [Bacteroides sp.]
MKLKYYFLGFTLLSGIYSCVDDKGSYEQIPINEVTISGIEENYTIVSGVTVLDIKPEITGTIKGSDDSYYKYTWYICKSTLSDDHEHTIISNEKNLNQPIQLAPGTYNLYLAIHDEETGMEWRTSASIEATTALMRGLYVMGDKADGTVGMDFITFASDTAVIQDIFINSTGLKGAEDLHFSGYYMFGADTQTLQAVTSSGSYRITNTIEENSRFDIDLSYDDDNTFFPTVEVKKTFKTLDIFPHQAAGGRTLNSASRGVVTEDAVYYSSIILGEAYANPINRYIAGSSELFRPYQTIFYNGLYLRGIIIYDLDNECFTAAVPVQYTLTNATQCTQLTDRVGDVFPWNQTNRTIVYGENPINGYNSYALMKDLVDQSKFYVYRFMCYNATPIKYYGGEISTNEATNLDKATHYAFYTEQDVLLYTVGSQLWGYNYTTKKPATMLKDFNSEITYMAFERVSASKSTDIAIATYDSGSKGKIYKYNINNNPNTIEITPIDNCEWSTDLKVVKLEYRYSPF